MSTATVQAQIVKNGISIVQVTKHQITAEIKRPVIAVAVTAVGPRGVAGQSGADGADGVGVPTGGTTGQVLKKVSNADFDTAWQNESGGGGGGAVTSVAGKTGVVTLDKNDVGLSNVDNTSDVNKPVSTATAAALAGKASTSHTHVESDVTGLTADLASKVPNTRTVNGQALSADVTITKSDVGLGNVDNTSDVNKPISTATQTALNGKASSSHTHTESEVTGLVTDLANKVDKNANITGATKTKITYDAKGLVTAGADATQDDIADGSTNRSYTNTEKTKLAGIATGATANSSDATLINRANHTGTQSYTTITGLGALATASTITASQISDSTVAGRAMLTAADVAAQTALLNTFTSALKGLVPSSGGGTTNFLRADGSWAAPAGGGSAVINQTTIDFGANEKSDEVFNITDAGISATSKIIAFVTWISSLGRDPDEIMADPISLSIEPLAGAMNIYAAALEGTVSGKYAINYQIG